VHERPLLMVPPCINKYYIMDLQPENSLVRYAVEQGHTAFLVSWRNVRPHQDQVTWDDYVGDLIEAIAAVKRITGVATLNTLGFCIGGTLLASALAVLEKKGANPSVSLTLLTTLLDFTEVGEIRVYIDEKFVAKREQQLKKGGIVPGGELPGPSRACAPTTSCGPTWSTTTSRASSRRPSTCSTGTRTPPTCPGPCTPTTCATRTRTTSSCSPTPW
jgi:hypothetical protein